MDVNSVNQQNLQTTKVISSIPSIGNVPNAPVIVACNDNNVPKAPQIKIPIPIKKVPQLTITQTTQNPKNTASNKKLSNIIISTPKKDTNSNDLESKSEQKQTDSKQDFKLLMMQKFQLRNSASAVISCQSDSTTSNANQTSISNFDKSPMTLNLPNKDLKTGKIIIDVPEGTKSLDRLDINKLINQANEQNRKISDSSSNPSSIKTETKVKTKENFY